MSKTEKRAKSKDAAAPKAKKAKTDKKEKKTAEQPEAHCEQCGSLLQGDRKPGQVRCRSCHGREMQQKKKAHGAEKSSKRARGEQEHDSNACRDCGSALPAEGERKPDQVRCKSCHGRGMKKREKLLRKKERQKMNRKKAVEEKQQREVELGERPPCKKCGEPALAKEATHCGSEACRAAVKLEKKLELKAKRKQRRLERLSGLNKGSDGGGKEEREEESE